MRGVDNIVRHHLRVAEGERVLILHRGDSEIVGAFAEVMRTLGADVRLTPIDGRKLAGSDAEVATKLRALVRDVDVALYLSTDEGDRSAS